MKSPTDLKLKLRRDWNDATKRESRMLDASDCWPIPLSIGKPRPADINSNLDFVRRHIQSWRSVRVGEVVWEPVKYRDTSDEVSVPVRWNIRNSMEWIRACADPLISSEFESLSSLLEHSDPSFHSLLIRKRSIWRDKPLEEVAQACRIASILSPQFAQGRPLRMVSLEGCDTKFFERHVRLLTTLLDIRFEGEVSRMGLESFLGAIPESEHWLLVIDLDGGLLPFGKLRVSSKELEYSPIPGKRLLIVENETCQHQLPCLPNTVAVLGAGFDLEWTKAEWLVERKVGYWGDIDTWGLQFLNKVRKNLPQVEALMMNSEIYERCRNAAVVEPIVAGTQPPACLTPDESILYQIILRDERGRLEQEFIPHKLVIDSLTHWCDPE